MPTKTSSQKSSALSRGASSNTKGKLVPSAKASELETKTRENAASSATVENGAASGAAKSKSKIGGPLSAKEIAHFQGLLLQERARLEEEREQIRSRSGSVDGALPEEGEGGDEDTADLASALMDKEMDLSVEDEIEDLLAAVDHAMQKIDDGTYGVCDMSGEPIPASRLELIPWAALTVECQALAEGQ